MHDTNPVTGASVAPGHDPDPPPRNGTWVLTDFSELSQFHFSQADATFTLADPAPVSDSPLGPPRPVERVSRSVVTPRRLGHRRWFEVATVTVYRNVKP